MTRDHHDPHFVSGVFPDADELYGSPSPSRWSMHLGEVEAIEELTEVLRSERRLLDSFLFRLIEIRNLLAAQETRFLAWAATDVERMAEAVREAELRRTVAVAVTAASLDVPPDTVTLTLLAELAPEPYANLLAEHRVALRRLIHEVEIMARDGRALAGKGLGQLDEEQRAVADADPDGADGPDGIDPTGIALDLEMARVAYSAAQVATSWFTLPSLRGFLA